MICDCCNGTGIKIPVTQKEARKLMEEFIIDHCKEMNKIRNGGPRTQFRE